MIKPSSVFLLLLGISSFLLASCSDSLQASSWTDKYANLKKYRTFAWIAPGDSALNKRRDDKFYSGVIVGSSNAELKKKGMVLESRNPDVVFMFDTRLEDHVKYSQSPSLSVGVGFAGPGYYVGGMAPVAGGNIITEKIEAGVLIIDMYDVQTGKLVWRGWAGSEIDYKTDVEAVIKRACHSIFFNLPIKHKS